MSRAGLNCCEINGRVVSKSMGRPAYRAGLRCGHSDRWIALDVTGCAFLNGADNYGAELLSLESPTPRARTYADCLSESSREVTLVAEAALRGHIR
jgi:hypothetical protein